MKLATPVSQTLKRRSHVAALILDTCSIPELLPVISHHSGRRGSSPTTTIRQRLRVGRDKICVTQAGFPISYGASTSLKYSTRSIPTMSSDDAYSSFLDQANQDTGASKSSFSAEAASTKAVDAEVPVELQKIEQYYTSEADEAFEPVSLQWDGKNMPSESRFSTVGRCHGSSKH